jgi:hypothetical protein
MAWTICVIALALATAATLIYWILLKPRGYDRWLGPYVMGAGKRSSPGPDTDVHVLLCIADHFEPKAQKVSVQAGQDRVDHWVREFPRQFARFQDSSGRNPRHTFFYPIEEYEPEYLDGLASLCRQGFGEVEVHLHHDQATAAGLQGELLAFKELLATRHQLLARRQVTGKIGYAFIHGNWALCNSRPDGRWCGVNSELAVLQETGCYADFTFPSAPSPTQPPTINSMYYAWDRPGRPRSGDTGLAIGTAPMPERSLLLIQGPLLLDWNSRKWGIMPRLENGCLQASQPPSLGRLDAWLRARVQVPARPDWYFVKLHAHGAPEEAHDVLLGAPMVRFHEALRRRARENPRFHYYYVTAREMYNLAKAAEAGYQGPVSKALDYLYVSNVCSEMTSTRE